MITNFELNTVIQKTVCSFPSTSPIVIDDVRFAAKVDGHDLSDISTNEIVAIMKTFCRSENGPRGPKDRASWFWGDVQ
jgi:hypothetical protein